MILLFNRWPRTVICASIVFSLLVIIQQTSRAIHLHESPNIEKALQALHWENSLVDGSAFCHYFDHSLKSGFSLDDLMTLIEDKLRTFEYSKTIQDTFSWLFVTHLLGSWATQRFSTCEVLNVTSRDTFRRAWQWGSPVHAAVWHVMGTQNWTGMPAQIFWTAVSELCKCSHPPAACFHGSGHGLLLSLMLSSAESLNEYDACTQFRPGAHVLNDEHRQLWKLGVSYLRVAPAHIRTQAQWGFYEQYFEFMRSDFTIANPRPDYHTAVAECAYDEFYPDVCFGYAFDWIGLLTMGNSSQAAFRATSELCSTITMVESNRHICQDVLQFKLDWNRQVLST